MLCFPPLFLGVTGFPLPPFKFPLACDSSSSRPGSHRILPVAFLPLPSSTSFFFSFCGLLTSTYRGFTPCTPVSLSLLCCSPAALLITFQVSKLSCQTAVLVQDFLTRPPPFSVFFFFPPPLFSLRHHPKTFRITTSSLSFPNSFLLNFFFFPPPPPFFFRLPLFFTCLYNFLQRSAAIGAHFFRLFSLSFPSGC